MMDSNLALNYLIALALFLFKHHARWLAGAEEPARSKPLPPINPNAPQLTMKGYFTVPSLKQLRHLADDKLKVSVASCLLHPHHSLHATHASPPEAQIIEDVMMIA